MIKHILVSIASQVSFFHKMEKLPQFSAILHLTKDGVMMLNSRLLSSKCPVYLQTSAFSLLQCRHNSECPGPLLHRQRIYVSWYMYLDKVEVHEFLDNIQTARLSQVFHFIFLIVPLLITYTYNASHPKNHWVQADHDL